MDIFIPQNQLFLCTLVLDILSTILNSIAHFPLSRTDDSPALARSLLINIHIREGRKNHLDYTRRTMEK